MSEKVELPHYAAKALARLTEGVRLCRTAADTEEAIQKGGGFLYFTAPDNRRFPPGSAKILIDRGLVAPMEDGLFAGISQTFVAVQP